MKTAHKIAKQIAGAYGNYSIALSFALKYVWRAVKQYGKKRFGQTATMNAVINLTTKKAPQNVDGVPAWLIRKNLSQDEAYAVLNENEGSKTVRETEKAKLIRFSTPYGAVEMWAPKSVLVAA